MFRDCLRCGHGWRNDPKECPVCTGMTDEQAAYILGMHQHMTTLRKIGRKAVDSKELSKEELALLGIYV